MQQGARRGNAEPVDISSIRLAWLLRLSYNYLNPIPHMLHASPQDPTPTNSMMFIQHPGWSSQMHIHGMHQRAARLGRPRRAESATNEALLATAACYRYRWCHPVAVSTKYSATLLLSVSRLLHGVTLSSSACPKRAVQSVKLCLVSVYSPTWVMSASSVVCLFLISNAIFSVLPASIAG